MVWPGFEAVADAFRDNFLHRREVGASVCVLHKGRTVVDLWGGVADARTSAPWERDTTSVVFSCTKGAAALCAHMLAEAGQLDLDAPITELWPEFGCGGKAGTTPAMMLAHTAPVPHLRAPVPPGGFADFAAMVAMVEAEEAWWPPGTRQGYHGLTFAWTVGNLIRLAGAETLSDFFRRRVALPLGLDFHIGLPESEEGRVARLIKPDPAEVNAHSKFQRAIREAPHSLSRLFVANTGGADFNTRQMHAAEIGSANGITNARGLAGLYAPLAGPDGGLLRPDSIARAAEVCAATFEDATLLQPMRFGLGFMARMDNRAVGGDSLLIGDRAFGHAGMGGSLGFADPPARLAFGYTMNRLGGGLLLNDRGQSLVTASYKSLN
jgi:CubicO group peptidase (beta-lactamase class C family)